jgi:hypothetical protein
MGFLWDRGEVSGQDYIEPSQEGGLDLLKASQAEDESDGDGIHAIGRRRFVERFTGSGS